MDQSVHRILASFIKSGAFDDEKTGNIEASVTSQDQMDLSKSLAEESLILLKNENNALPLDLNKKKQNILVIGDNN